MANGLLNGIVEYWQPDAVLGTLKGMVAGIDFLPDPPPFVLVVTPDPTSPTGVALSASGGIGHNSGTVFGNALLSGWGQDSDWLAMFVWKTPPSTGERLYNRVWIGDNNTDGWFLAMSQQPVASSYNTFGEIPGGDAAYYDVQSSGAPFAADSWHVTLLWWELDELTLYLQTDAGTIYTTPVLAGAGAPEDNNCAWSWGSGDGGTAFTGGIGTWRGTIPDAAQRALLSGGLPFDQFDDGGGEESFSKMEVINQTAFDGLASGASLKASCSISASKTSGALASAQNPTGAAVIATLARVHVKTGSSAACTADVGTASTLVTNDGLLDGISVNAAANTVYDNITDHGTNGRTRQYVPAGGYFTAFVATGDANGLVADFYWDYMRLTGGTVFTPGSL